MTARNLQEQAQAMRCDECGRPGMVRHLVGGATTVTVHHKSRCSHHPRRRRHRGA